MASLHTGPVEPTHASSASASQGPVETQSSPQGDGARLAPGPDVPQHASSASALQGPAETQSSPQGDGARSAPGPGVPQHASSASALQGPSEAQSSPQGEGARFAQEPSELDEAPQNTSTTDPPSLSTRYFPAREAVVEGCPWRVLSAGNSAVGAIKDTVAEPEKAH